VQLVGSSAQNAALGVLLRAQVSLLAELMMSDMLSISWGLLKSI